MAGLFCLIQNPSLTQYRTRQIRIIDKKGPLHNFADR